MGRTKRSSREVERYGTTLQVETRLERGQAMLWAAVFERRKFRDSHPERWLSLLLLMRRQNRIAGSVGRDGECGHAEPEVPTGNDVEVVVNATDFTR